MTRIQGPYFSQSLSSALVFYVFVPVVCKAWAGFSMVLMHAAYSRSRRFLRHDRFTVWSIDCVQYLPVGGDRAAEEAGVGSCDGCLGCPVWP